VTKKQLSKQLVHNFIHILGIKNMSYEKAFALMEAAYATPFEILAVESGEKVQDTVSQVGKFSITRSEGITEIGFTPSTALCERIVGVQKEAGILSGNIKRRTGKKSIRETEISSEVEEEVQSVVKDTKAVRYPISFKITGNI
jgi:hypothetical protein